MSPLAKFAAGVLAYAAAVSILMGGVWFLLFVVTHLPKGIAL